MLFDLPSDLQCGALAGYKFPKKGPIKDAVIEWSGSVATFNDYKRLSSLGAVVADAKTNARGLATLTMTPHPELLSGVGQVEIESGVLQPTLRLGETFGNTSARFWDAFTPPSFELKWLLERHKPRGYRVNFVSPFRAYFSDVPETKYTFAICGADPYAKPWTGRVTSATGYVADPGGSGSIAPPYTVFSVAAPAEESAPILATVSSDQPGALTETDGTFIFQTMFEVISTPTPFARLTVRAPRYEPATVLAIPGRPELNVRQKLEQVMLESPVEEETSCPDR